LPKRLTGNFVVVALHPAIDRTIRIPRFRSGGAIRGRLVLVEAAGKGMNITCSLAGLGHDVVAHGFLGRSDEEFFRASLPPGRVRAGFVTVGGDIRRSITIIEAEKETDTHILSGSMRVGRQDIRRLMSRLRSEVGEGDWAVFGGSLPDGMQPSDYVRALSACGRRGARVIVDTSGPMLRAALGEKPWLVKPNREELGELVGRRLRARGKILDAAHSLLDRCGHVLVSLGAEGALLVTPSGSWHAQETRRAKVVHTVGCGDALLAGFLSAYASGKKPEESLRFGVACGSACVRSRHAAIASRRDPNRFLPRIRVSSTPANSGPPRT